MVGQIVVGNENKKKLSLRQKEMKKLKYRINKEKDPDIKRELRQGGTVEIIDSWITFHD